MQKVLIDAIELETGFQVKLAMSLKSYDETYPQGLIKEDIMCDSFSTYRVLSVPQIKEV